MLNAHPQICFPPETHFFRRYVASGKAERLYATGGREALLADLTSDELMRRLGVDIGQVLTSVMSESRKFTAACLYTALIKAYVNKPQALSIGDKDPRSIEFLPAIHHFFPEAYIVHVIRDPRDNIVSRMGAAWSSGRSFYHHLFVYNTQLRMGRRLGQELFAGRYVELIYERLIRQPEEALQNLCHALPVNYDPQMLDFNKAAQKLVMVDEMAWKKEALGPLLTGNTGKWKGVFANRQTALSERLCGDVMTELGYPLTGQRWFWSGIISQMLRQSGRIYANYRHKQQKRAFSQS
jgi:hypothetical protein